MLLLSLLIACHTPTPIEYDIAPTTDHVSLRGANLSVNGKVLRVWDDASVVDGIHPALLTELNGIEGHDKVLIEEPEDTPGHILPVLLATVWKAGRTEVAITSTGSPVMPGPIVFEEVEVQLDPCPDKLLPNPRWLAEMQPSLAYREVFERAISIQDEGMPHFPVKVQARCVPPVPAPAADAP